MNIMRKPRIGKVVVNMGLGESGEPLEKAEKLLQQLTDQAPVRTKAKVSNRDFGIRKGEPIGVKVTLRHAKADSFLKRALEAKEKTLAESNFDNKGNFAFGIGEHIDLPSVKYDPAVGIFGMDVAVTLERSGFRIKRRKIQKKSIHHRDYVTVNEAMEFVKENFGVRIV
ncbi:MAG: 50S ribosomal protein L5 [Theionarchaea archaeon]|nr:50S ribosomal protein L5 [Theionarchaea archaeon]MBU7001773.1 50S ribosomal protein L5 [Theionarchaea archaeon]MBU7022278.1 50S ribosomal protein L5 [Theionarchaea archaeon]MBU7035512.1 50S ribosomal protein L5 [Theionarchaea archaeon]MBU7041141.1 50S ribosomal protein L5 [Theionarchaea archaeon]